MSGKNSEVDAFLNAGKPWHEELMQLRNISLECQLSETLKWRQPCYTYQGNNILILGSFKSYCTVSFFKGALLKDAENLLKRPGGNTRSGRIIPFTNLEEIQKLEKTLRTYIYEAIEVEKAGLKVPPIATEKVLIPEELAVILKNDTSYKKAFYALTPGRQRGYVLYFSGAKQSKTRASRIEKYRPQILAGYGFHDCTCGHSQKPPGCDGSHKHIG